MSVGGGARGLVAVGAAAALVGCSSGTSHSAPRATTPAVSSSPSTAVPSPTVAEPAADANAEVGYFGALVTRHPLRLQFDRAQAFFGSEADRVAAAHGVPTPVPGGVYVYNEFRVLKNVTVADQVSVIGRDRLNDFTHSAAGANRAPHTVAALLAFLRTTAARTTPFRVTYDKAGAIVAISEQYVP